MTHEEMNELYEFYSLGALDFREATQIDEHVADGCEYCLTQIREAINFTATFSGLAETVAPRPELKTRIMQSIQPDRTASARGPRGSIAGFALLAAACAALGIFSYWSMQQSREVRAELNHAVSERNQLRAALEILTEQQTRTVRFGQSPDSPHGWLFVNRDSGFVFADRNFRRFPVIGRSSFGWFRRKAIRLRPGCSDRTTTGSSC